MKQLSGHCVEGGTQGQSVTPEKTTNTGVRRVEESPLTMEHKPHSALSAAQRCEELHTYIMCGGGGTRLWPLSRADNPKQNLKLLSANSMLAETVMRVNRIDIPELVSVVNLMGNISQSENMRSAHNNFSGHGGVIITEPFGKNTAPAVAIASLHAGSMSEDDPYVLILPSDHLIKPNSKFSNAIARGLNSADKGEIVLFGVEPSTPNTGYGYIEVEEQAEITAVKSFKEKPDLATAKRYLKTGKHLWNAGIFLFRASTMQQALQKFAPEIWTTCEVTLNSASQLAPEVQLRPEEFQHIPADSIDFAVMEHARNITVVRADFDWHDVGSFASLKEIQKADQDDNVIQGDVIAQNVTGSIIHSEGHLVAALGLENLSVIATPDVTMIAPLDRAQDIRHLAEQIEKTGRKETKQSPWLEEAGVVPGTMQPIFRQWLSEQAWPFWLEHGLDKKHGGFHEVLDMNGQSTGADKRLRSMARQIFAFAKAAAIGWDGGAQDAVLHGLKFLEESPAGPSGGWHKTFSDKSKPNDLLEDAYDHAFVLLALAQTQKAGIKYNPNLLKRVTGTLNTLRIKDASGKFHGYAENNHASLPRRSNPHMHLLEAMMAFYEASGDQSSLDRAGEIVGLFENHFFDPKAHLLGEYFDQNLNFVDGFVAATEPGHQFEWAHLLHKFARLSNKEPSTEISGLFANAFAFGINPVSKFAYDEISRDGTPKHYTSRFWVQTELLSCLSVLCANGKEHLRFEAERHAQNMWAKYVTPAPQGMWIDVVDNRGAPVSTTVPASTFYHIIGSIENYTKNIG